MYPQLLIIVGIVQTQRADIRHWGFITLLALVGFSFGNFLSSPWNSFSLWEIQFQLLPLQRVEFSTKFFASDLLLSVGAWIAGTTATTHGNFFPSYATTLVIRFECLVTLLFGDNVLNSILNPVNDLQLRICNVPARRFSRREWPAI